MCDRIPFKDKGCHWLVGVLIGILALYYSPFEYDPIILAFLVGFIKELVDKYIRKTVFDVYDLIATTLGGAFIWSVF
jgi:glycopeptide antibiotics resistance protein